jgi:hypothetical protein
VHSLLDALEFIIAVAALLTQILATVLARPLRPIMSASLWRALMALNGFVIVRRFITIWNISAHPDSAVFDGASVFCGMGVSVTMLLMIVYLRYQVPRRAYRNIWLESLAAIRLKKEKELDYRDSLAYQLALHFIEQQEKRNTKSKEV